MRQRLFSLFRFLPLFLLVALITVSTASAQEIAVEKRVEQENVRAGSLLAVRITVHNLGGSAVDVVVQEVVVGAEPFSPAELVVPQAPAGFIGVRLPYYEWELSLAPGESEEILYIIRPLTPGEYVIAPTRAYANGRQFLSNSATVSVACNANSVCESGFSENHMNCPADCPSGSGDLLCDFAADGVCDPDCATAADSDCHLLEYAESAGSSETVPLSRVSFPLPVVLLAIIVFVPVSGMFLIGAQKNRK